MPRGRRIKGRGESFYHIMSRKVEKDTYFTDEENLHNVLLLRRAEEFSGVQVLAYCFMGNHMHILLRVPVREPVSEEELLRRVGVLYGEEYRLGLEDRWSGFDEAGLHSYTLKEQNALRKRMYDMGEFMKTLKQRQTMHYNKQHDRKGTIWEERYKSILLEATPRVLSAVAAYIDLNPVRAGISKTPEAYAFSSYGEAFRGNERAQLGIQRLYQEGDTLPSWDVVGPAYKERITLKVDATEKRARVTRKELHTILENVGKRALSELLGFRMRFFSFGYALGSEDFVKGITSLRKVPNPLQDVVQKIRQKKSSEPPSNTPN